MLKSLFISNFAIIDELHVEFDSKLNIITGETGAGKSILLGVLVLVLGQRADTRVLREEYRKSQFYFQLSMFEGFGLALCEAMLCECVPIGSSVNMIPEIIGETGFILEKKDINELIKLVDQILSSASKDELGQRAKDKIINDYSIEKRRKKLLDIIDKTI